MLEVGEFIRTRTGIIMKVDIIDFEKLTISQIGIGYDFEDVKEMEDFIKNEIVKHSKNIIDLIEVGDYVNGYKIIMDLQTSKQHYNTQNEFVTAVGYTFANDEIKSIITKEQFANIEYKVDT